MKAQINFWDNLPKPFTALAPMAEVTDLPFRRITMECGRPDVFYTEFVSADGLASPEGKPRLLKDLEFDKSEHPIVAQFFGINPENMKKAAETARVLGFDGVDINMGCPERKIVKSGAGIGLAKNPNLARELIAAAKEGAKNIPVSVKTRLGVDKPDLEGWIAWLLDSGVSAIAVHMRTMREMSKTKARWEYAADIAKMAESFGIIVIGNGDIENLKEADAICKKYGMSGTMIGRGVFKNPWIFNKDEKNIRDNPRERLKLLVRHTRYFREYWGDAKNFNVLKKFYKIYISGWSGARELRNLLMNAKTAADVDSIVKSSDGMLK